MSAIRWPAGFEPSSCPVHTVNELTIDAPIEAAWAWLVRAGRWSEWYSNCKRLRFESGSGPDLALATRFTWVTFGVRVDTTVREFEPPQRLAWEGRGLGARGYHAWLLRPTGRGCHVVTEEVQAGLAPSLARVGIRRGLLHYHQRWLEGLARRAEGGPPADLP